jgi:curved DNA-binding protein
MSIEYKDYYEILQVSRAASAAEIRKAFRRLARECHPDVASDRAEGELRFREVNEAYEVLSDSGKRHTYDSIDRDWRPRPEFHRYGSGNGQPTAEQGAAHRGTTFEFRLGDTGFSDFFEALFGPNKANPRRTVDPQDLSSDGDDLESEIVVSLEEVMHGSVRALSLGRKVRCSRCYGAGSVNSAACPVCQGKGEVSQREKYNLRIPAGVREGQRLRLAGQGDSGRGHGRTGDLYLRVQYAKHPAFKVEWPHLLYELPLAPWEAVLGANASVRTLRGEVSIRVPAGAQPGDRLRVRGHGLPQREGECGDLHVILRVQFPTQLTDRERAIWVQLAAASSFQARP